MSSRAPRSCSPTRRQRASPCSQKAKSRMSNAQNAITKARTLTQSNEDMPKPPAWLFLTFPARVVPDVAHKRLCCCSVPRT
jgi:hypothetical protein